MSEASSGSSSTPDPRLYQQQPPVPAQPQPVPPPTPPQQYVQPAPQQPIPTQRVQPAAPTQSAPAQPAPAQPAPHGAPTQAGTPGQQFGGPGYGYPHPQHPQQAQQAAQPNQPPQQTYAPPQAGPAYGGGPAGPGMPGTPGAPGGAQREPDWAGMAADYERNGKRKRLMVLSGALVAGLAVIGGVVWFGLSGSKNHPDAGPSTSPAPVASASASSSASGPASPDPSPSHTPPLAPADVFAKKTLTIDGKTFTKAGDDNADPCWKASMDGLGTVLTKNGCAQVLRGTYATGNHAVTVAVVVFHSKADAQAAGAAFVGKVTPLYGNNVDSFCVGKAGCAVTHAVSGRFLYIAESGLTGASASTPDALSNTAGHAAASYVLSSLLKIEQNS
ncbi:hypothetical protein [Streptacidiphilus anmyonensis]|uniref:hypothetical protein n=1 Tax=Streptacidiphilus anmyonensis TaxID=405782 RepID=UPI0005A80499|nr:hypothetical protein [Streptacidiphilus anmyonensis]